MIKKLFLFAIIGIAITLDSCKKDSNDDPGDPIYDAKYNEASVDQNKASIENSGVEFTQDIDEMKDLDAMKIAINLAKIMSESSMMSTSAALNTGMTPVTILSSIGKKTATNSTISSQLKSVGEDPENLADAWDMIVGTYEYNIETDDFEQTAEGGDEVIIKFPGFETDITNTAQIRIYNLDYKEITEPFYGEEETNLVGQKLPTSLTTELNYEGNTLVTWNFTASFKDNGMPTSFSSVLTIDPFSLSVTLTHEPYSNATYKYSFKKSSKILLEIFAEMNGNWSEENIDNNVETVTETGESYGDEHTEVYFENIVKNANAYFQVLNIKIAGKVDFNKLIPIIRDLDEKDDNGEVTDKEYADAMVEAINNNAQLVVLDADKGEMIAKVEIYTYYDEEYDSWESSAKFIFGDGSSIDADTYIANGDYNKDFGGLIDEINQLIDDFNYDYDAGIPNVE
jgi:hypothetical protein